MVNDGGDDEQVLTALDEAASTDSRIVVVHQNNSGPSRARNHGTVLAVGDYVTYLDSDDELTPYALEEAVDILERYQSELLIGYLQRVWNSEETMVRESNSVRKLDEFEARSLLEFTIAPSGGDSLGFKKPDGSEIKIGPTCRFVQTEIAKSCPFPEDLHVGEDSVWNLDLLGKVESILICDSIWYWYWISVESTSRRYRDDAVIQAQILMQAMDDRLLSSNSHRIEERLFLRWINEVMRVSKDYYSRPESRLPFKEKIRAARGYFRSRQAPKRLVFSVVRSFGTNSFIKYFLCRTGLAPAFWSLGVLRKKGSSTIFISSRMGGQRLGR